ncbi:MAG: hypothetical protein ABFD98_15705 [Syntrophobacteraceae bacterium]|nr:hypothetical protein [Desulfobacteraceae bacterium]
MELSDEGLQLILDGEVGGGRKFYEKRCRRPIVSDPAGAHGGITIGIGCDLGQMDRSRFIGEWGGYLTSDQLDRLEKACGLRDEAALQYLPKVRDINVGWEAALMHFQAYSVPRFMTLVEKAFPGICAAPACVREGLLSLVFNRGTSMRGGRRREMREILYMVASGKFAEIPGKIREMKRLWPDSPGLQKRREAEARHIEEGLKSISSQL